ncbi:MAG: ABC transporter permease [Limisphaerales bacterium]
MGLAPVILRELIGQSRQPTTYWLRVLSAAVLMGAFFLAATASSSLSGREMGARLFDALNLTTYHLILVCVPLLTADCISREKREGTLGLLFLTPLRPRDIVLGKAVTQALRGATLLLALAPMLLLPSLLGGVGWRKALLSFTFQASAFLIALTAGLVVSSLSKGAIRSALGSVMLAVVGAIPLNLVMGSFFGAELWPPLFLPGSWIAASAGIGLRELGLATAVIGSGVLFVVGVGLWQTTQQVGNFWQEADHSVGKMRATVNAWVRLVAFAAFGTQGVMAIGGLTLNVATGVRETQLLINLLFFGSLVLLVPVVVVNTLAARLELLATRRDGWTIGASSWASARNDWVFLGAWLMLSGGLTVGSMWYSNALGIPAGAGTPGARLNGMGDLAFLAVNGVGLFATAAGAGALAFVWRRHWSTALAWSSVFSAALVAGLLTLQGSLAFLRVDPLLGEGNARLNTEFGQAMSGPLLGLALNLSASPRFLTESSVYLDIPAEQEPVLTRIVFQNAVGVTALMIVTALGAAWMAMRGMAGRRSITAFEEQRALRRDFCEPLVGGGWFRARQRRLLEVNPIRWLHQRSWSARLTSWGWCLAVVVAQVPVIVELRSLSRIFEHQVWLLTALQAGMAFAAAGTFQREKASGALELILVTPVSARQLICGRWLALVRQFAPSFLVIAILAIAAARLWAVNRFPWEQLIPIVTALLPAISIPLLGLYWSLRLRGTVAAWLSTVGCGLLLALATGLPGSFLAQGLRSLSNRSRNGFGDEAIFAVSVGIGLAVQLLAARWVWKRLIVGLASRRLLLA